MTSQSSNTISLSCFRDPRGFAVKFYTEEGNWDLVGNNTPIFFIRFEINVHINNQHKLCHISITNYSSNINYDDNGRDPILFPSFIHTQKRNPQTHLKDPDAFWDFISLMPMTTHQVSFLFSDRGTPNGYRFMNG